MISIHNYVLIPINIDTIIYLFQQERWESLWLGAGLECTATIGRDSSRDSAIQKLQVSDYDYVQICICKYIYV
jgi:hypothetical protein